MNYDHNPYHSTSWRRAALAILVVAVAAAVVLGVAYVLGMELKF